MVRDMARRRRPSVYSPEQRNPAEEAEHNIAWRAKCYGLETRGAAERGAQLAQMPKRPNELEPIGAKPAGLTRPRRKS